MLGTVKSPPDAYLQPTKSIARLFFRRYRSHRHGREPLPRHM